MRNNIPLTSKSYEIYRPAKKLELENDIKTIRLCEKFDWEPHGVQKRLVNAHNKKIIQAEQTKKFVDMLEQLKRVMKS